MPRSGRAAQTGRPAPVFVVASLQPRAGKTLLARLLAEHFVLDAQPIAAFDVNPNRYVLAERLPKLATMASVEDVKGQMALFDRLVAGDDTIKVVDVGHDRFERFFAVMHELAAIQEMARKRITPVVLFIADAGRHSAQAYALLRRAFVGLVLVPVINEGIPASTLDRDDFPPSFGGSPLQIPQLGAVVRGVIDRPSFSFADYSAKNTDPTAELYGWIRKVFLQFREIELRLVLEELRPALRPDTPPQRSVVG